jgi:hypothetical protein
MTSPLGSKKQKKEKFGSSNRAFGYIFTILFLILTFSPLIHAKEPRWYLLYPAAILFLVASFAPKLLHWPAKLWLSFGHLLSKITSPIIAGVIFYVVFGISGLLMRLFNNDPLAIKENKKKLSYWKKREENPDSFYFQF